MGEDVRVEDMTDREKRIARAAFFDGADYILSTGPIREATWNDRIHAQQRSRYPIRKRVPRVVVLSGGWVRATVGGDEVVMFQDDRGDSYEISLLSSADIPIIADLLARPYDEVAE